MNEPAKPQLARRWSLETSSRAAFWLAILSLGGIAVVATYTLRKAKLDVDWVAHTNEVILQAETLRGHLIDVESGQRGFLVSGQDAYLAPFETGRRRVLEDLLRLADLTKDNQSQRQRCAALVPLVKSRIATAERQVELRRTQGFAAAQSDVLQGHGKAQMDAARRELDEFVAMERQLLDARNEAARQSAGWAMTVIAGFGGLALVFLLLAGRRIRNEIAGRRAEHERSESLNTALQRQAVVLAEAKGRAESADRLKSAFLAAMSHELRTPLNSIIGFTGIVLQGLAGPLNPEQTKQLGMVRGSARHLLALINDVLDISKIEADQMTVSKEPFDLATVVASVVASVQPQAEKKGLVLTVAVAPEVGRMVGDERRVGQVLLNLLSNAIKFTERGGVALRVETTGQVASLGVTDTGIGIKPEELRKLFVPFRQADSGLSRNHEGTGLGLAICRRLAELMGGSIDVTSEWGQGSTFVFTLPLGKETAA